MTQKLAGFFLVGFCWGMLIMGLLAGCQQDSQLDDYFDWVAQLPALDNPQSYVIIRGPCTVEGATFDCAVYIVGSNVVLRGCSMPSLHLAADSHGCIVDPFGLGDDANQ